MTERPLDLLCLGRAAVDLYGEQVGGRLEDIQSFAKYVGGCPANIAIGTARLGLKSGVISRVGDEQMGRFVVETVTRCAQLGVPVLAMTDSALSPIARDATLSFEIQEPGDQGFRTLVAPILLAQVLVVGLGRRLALPTSEPIQ